LSHRPFCSDRPSAISKEQGAACSNRERTIETTRKQEIERGFPKNTADRTMDEAIGTTEYAAVLEAGIAEKICLITDLCSHCSHIL